MHRQRGREAEQQMLLPAPEADPIWDASKHRVGTGLKESAGDRPQLQEMSN